MKNLNVNLKLKPLSANKMFYRNKNKTVEYRRYQEEMRDYMMGMKWDFGKEYVGFEVKAGFSNRAADLDNIIKPILDTFQNIFEDFNDNRVYEIKLHKDIVRKGNEYVNIKVYSEGMSELS